MANGYEILEGTKPEARITWTVAAGPLAGTTLAGGAIDTLPDHGKVVVFGGMFNARALKSFVAAGVLKNRQSVTLTLAGKPELAALVAEAEAAVAAKTAAIEAEAAKLEPIGLTYEIGCDGPDRWRLLWPEGASEAAIAIGSERHGTQGLERHIRADDVKAVAVAEIAANLATYGGWECDADGLRSLLALAEARAAEALAAKSEARKAKEVAVADKQSQAVASGQPVLIDSWTEDCDGSVAECSTDICKRYAMPDGTTAVRRTHAH